MAEKHEAGEHTLSHRIAAKADKIKYLVLAVIIVAAAAIALVSHQRRTAEARETEAENKLFQTQIDIQKTPEEDALPILTGLSDDLKGLPAGAQARIMQFSYAYNTKNYAAAEKAARDYLAAYPKSSMAGRVNLALAQSLAMQDKTAEATAIFEALVKSEQADVFPEASLAVAQMYEREAAKLRDGDPAAYRRQLEKAERAYNEVIVRSQTPGSAQIGYWPISITIPANFALVALQDKIAGYEHESPRGPEAAAPSGAGIDAAVMATPPPADGEAAAAETPEAESAAESTESDESGAAPAETSGEAGEAADEAAE